MDPCVLDIPFWKRFLLVNGIIAPFRAPKSAEAYQQVWTEEGSPLICLTEKLAALVEKELGFPVRVAMRYQSPSIEDTIRRLLLEAPRIKELILIPMYPQYAMSTTESTVRKMNHVMKAFPGVSHTTVSPFFDKPAFLDSQADLIRKHLTPDADYLLFSYHGVPERHIIKGDPTGKTCLSKGCCERDHAATPTCYRAQCVRTTTGLLERLEKPELSTSIAFQSRLGRDPWLSPSTADEIERLAKSGVKRLAIVCPSFVTDCLETLEEINVEARESFLANGGEAFHYIPCVNDNADWAKGLADLIKGQ